MNKLVRGLGVWVWGIVAVFIALTVLVSTQAFSAAISVTAQPILNSGPGGALTYSQDWSAASNRVTRHESSDLTLNVSDQVTSVSVQGTKASGAADVKVDLLDSSLTIVDTATVSLPSASGAYDQSVTLTLETVKLVGVAEVLATYTAVYVPVSILDAWIVDGTYATQDLTYIPSAGSSRLVVIGITAEKNQAGPVAVSQVSLGDAALTEIDQQNVGSATAYHNVVWMGYLNEAGIAGRTGDTVTITYSNAPSNPFGEPKVAVATYQGVDQTTPIAASSSAINASSATLQPGNVAVGENDQVVYVALAGQHMTHSAPTGYTEHIEVVGPNNDHAIAVASRNTTTASTENPVVTWSASTRLGVVAAVLNAE